MRTVRTLPMLLLVCLSAVVAAQRQDDGAWPAPPTADISTLSAALRSAMQHNPAVKGMRSEVDSSRHDVSVARSARYPTLSAYSDSFERRGARGTVRMQVPVWSFGRIGARVRHAEASFDAEQIALADVQRRLIEDTAVAYGRVQGVRKRIDIAGKNVARHTELHEQIRRRHEGQMASETDVRLAYSRLLHARSAIPRLEGDLRIALTDLDTLTRGSASAATGIDPAVVELPRPEHVRQLALDQSAAVKEKQARVEVARSAVRQEKAAVMPSLYFRAEHDLNEVEGVYDQTRVGLVLEANLDGMGFGTARRAKGAASRADAAHYDLSATRNEVARRIEQLLADREVQTELVTAQREMVAVFEDTVASFIRQYDTGRKSWLDVLNTQRELFELQMHLEQLRNDRLVASLRIATMIGRLDELAGLSQP